MEYSVIFDMDGVLVDSYEMIWDSANKILGRQGVHLSEEDIKKYVGRSFKDVIVDWNLTYGLNLELESFREEIWDLELKFLKSMKPDRGLVKLLDDLNSKEVQLAVGTSSQKFRADIILDYLDLTKYFPVVISANDVELHKPSPDVFLKAAEKLKFEPEKCVVIEDAASGIEAARRGRMKSIGYVNGHNEFEDVCNADLVINNFSEINYNLIERIFH
ncbi:Phosphoglycolate phosphatase [uncultured archaeon]|nr:Phosphoglycolate phosphatase [uncultured archaeon]